MLEYINIKSEPLRDILRVILKDVSGLSLGADMPSTSAYLHLSMIWI